MSPTLDQQLNEKLRDAQLALYLTHAVPSDPVLSNVKQAGGIKTADELYSYWLLDVLVSEAVPTSRVACAIASLQQYINAITLGLEPGYETEGMSRTQLDQWHNTLHNYSVWHASQQVRYFPSTYLSPELRSHKTENFQKLENDINQCRIQPSTILSAVQNYLNRFEDIANLTTLSGYIDGDINSMADSMYYFVGKSRAENTYYWRSLDMSKRALYPATHDLSNFKQDAPEATAWSDWKSIPIPASANIPDRSIRPVYFNNRVFITWAQIISPTSSASQNTVFSGREIDEDEKLYKMRLEPYLKSNFTRVSLNFIFQKYDGSWSMPQVCIDEYCALRMSTDEINAATTTIATLDSTTQPGSLFLGLSIQKNQNNTKHNENIFSSDFYQAVRLDLQFGIERLFSSGTVEDYLTWPHQRAVAERHWSIFVMHNHLNFNFHAPRSEFSDIHALTNTQPHTNHHHWNYDNQQIRISDLVKNQDIKFNTTTSALEISSTLTADFNKHQSLSFEANDNGVKIKMKLALNLASSTTQLVDFHSESLITLRHLKTPPESISSISISNNGTSVSFSQFSSKLNVSSNGSIEDKGHEATQKLTDNKIDIDTFNEFFYAQNPSYTITVNLNDNQTLTFEKVVSTPMERSYKQVILLLLDQENPTPPRILRSNTLILGATDFSRRYIRGSASDLKAAQKITVQLQINPKTLRPNIEQALTSDEQTSLSTITLLHGVIIHDTDVQGDISHLMGYALKSSQITLNKNANPLIPLAPRLKRIASKNNGAAECIDFSESAIKHSDASAQNKLRAPIRMNTSFAEKLTQAASVSLDTLFTLTPTAWLEPSLIEGGPDQPLDFHGAHGKYYWELFLYLPWLVAHRLNLEQRYAEAQAWMHYLFDPAHNATVSHETQRHWRLNVLSAPLSDLSYAQDNPHDPNQIALSAPVHFRRALFQLYLDILINRGDAAYRQATADSLAEAKLWYVRVKSLLGPRPTVTSIDPWTSITLGELSAAPSSELRNLERQASNQDSALVLVTRLASVENLAALMADTSYLRRPLNPSLMARWDKIDSRLHNLRHHLDLVGKPLQVSLFASPLSPHAFIARALQGGNVGNTPSAASLQAQASHYRFHVIQAHAMAATENLIQFGTTLLSLIERKDQSEHMALQHAQAWDLSKISVEQQSQALLIDEKNQAALRAGRKSVEARVKYFSKQLLEGINQGEAQASQQFQDSANLEIGAYGAQAAAGALMMLPNIFGTSNGGIRLEGSMYAVQAIIQGVAHEKRASAAHLDRTEQFNRRNQEWEYSLDQARLELSQIDAQLETYAEQVTNTRLQLRHTETALAQAMSSYEILSKRFSNSQLYQWLNSQLSAFYFLAYDVTHSLCLAAQACWQYERADWKKTFIQSSHWNNQYRGLSAGEALKLNLLQMDAAYLQHNARALEIRKTVSLRQLPDKDSSATLNKQWDVLKTDLISSGTVNFEFTQALFDADYPGHHLRRIKSISVSLPATLGPYEDIRATLTQTYNKIQHSEQPDESTENLHVREQIALSSGVNDSGLFTLSFDNDSRYLPFEYTGAVSRWQLFFPNHNAQLSMLESLTDIIVHVHYTSSAGAKA
ncbi:neuraminidase-like domain-containing protein [Pseudomonas sp. CCC3.1]|uniref:Tc toxin subunit A-related protein n=1 Tax=Pseudomonas sp. CCC3.1 TaxID=3048607 RepID=UPI002AC9BEA6|nr:neuraminidase-like domain-containing protein [Pseudomonas sp. CCC3.1]MEB0206599.1 neuraminidase-like domain-containing protein [Pseudomonas sp. CCC3.1]WPX34268.1 neuraminidase-like domain-containing protein [Pseudomonas sp. CCC3.1]